MSTLTKPTDLLRIADLSPDELAALLDLAAAMQVDPALMELAAPDAVFLHCLPAHRGEEVAPAVIDGPQSAVWQQAANRLPTEQAVLHALTTGDWKV
jgi:ornithine carbamoyltransferase